MDERYVTPRGDEIRKRRKLKAWTQGLLATQSGVGKRTIERMENGEAARLDTINSIAASLECDPSLLISLDAAAPLPAFNTTSAAPSINSVLRHKDWGSLTPSKLAQHIL